MGQTHAEMIVGSLGAVTIPARALEEQGLSYNDEVRLSVDVSDSEHEEDQVATTGFVRSDSKVTIPASIRRRYNILPHQPREVSFERTGRGWDDDTPTGTRGGNRK